MNPLQENISHQLTFTVLLNCYLREFENHSRYNLIPDHDPEVATYMRQSGNTELIKIEFMKSGVEVYCPLSYYSATGRHAFKFPIVHRKKIHERILPISCIEFAQSMLNENNPLTIELNTSFKADIFLFRLNDTIRNLSAILNYRILEDKNIRRISDISLPFIEAEQALILGHSMHPLAKNRLGFDADDFFRYSPEFNKPFRLFYFLAHPSIVFEGSAEEHSTSELVKQHVCKSSYASGIILAMQQHPGWKLIPMHPWQAAYMLKQQVTQELLNKNLLMELGEAGEKEFLATSSVRTIYAQRSEFMYKFSLNVQVTNAERINMPKELHAGKDISELFNSSWGQQLISEFPDFCFITDPAFITLTYHGELLHGFSTTLRHNPFRTGNENVTPAASLCQDSIADVPGRLMNIINTYASTHQLATKQTAKKWFNRYLDVLLDPLIKIYNKYGLAIEAHLQNIVVGLDHNGFPQKIYYRDNQGYFIRSHFSEQVKALVQGFGEKSECIISESYVAPKYTYYLLINNIFGFISTLGASGLVPENELIEDVYYRLHSLAEIDNTGLVKYILESRSWEVKGNLLMGLNNLNELNMPMERPALFADYLNPFMFIQHFCKEFIYPEDTEIKYTRHFPEMDYTLELRPFDMKKDLDIVYNWVNLDYAKKFWNMDGPIQSLEAFYIKNCCCDYSCSVVGLLNGEQVFVAEPYWPMRDIVGKYYDAQPHDYGFHMILRPPTNPPIPLSVNAFRVTMEYMFSFSKIGRIIGEADHRNTKVQDLVTQMGYQLMGVIALPDKHANLTICTREDHCKKFPELRSQLLELQSTADSMENILA